MSRCGRNKRDSERVLVKALVLAQVGHGAERRATDLSAGEGERARLGQEGS
jgi:ABC-type hemin transport system ATPase subunit